MLSAVDKLDISQLLRKILPNVVFYCQDKVFVRNLLQRQSLLVNMKRYCHKCTVLRKT